MKFTVKGGEYNEKSLVTRHHFHAANLSIAYCHVLCAGSLGHVLCAGEMKETKGPYPRGTVL